MSTREQDIETFVQRYNEAYGRDYPHTVREMAECAADGAAFARKEVAAHLRNCYPDNAELMSLAEALERE